jgi:hypothetical protein
MKTEEADSQHLTAQSRRAFLRNTVVAAATIASTAIDLNPLAKFRTSEAQAAVGPSAHRRRVRAYNLRKRAAHEEREIEPPPHPTNGDEDRYSNFIGNFSKGLPHDGSGEVDSSAYQKMVAAMLSGDDGDFAAIPLGGNVKLINPQSGLAFDLEGTDSHQLAIPPAPALASAWRAGEAVENYWQALLRDVPFSSYATDSGAQAAIADLNKLSDFRGPRSGGKVTAGTLFRGFTEGDLVGHYISQFFYQPFNYGALEVAQRYVTYLPLSNGGSDYLISFSLWLAAQNGEGPFGPNAVDPTARFIRTGRDLAAWVHVDVLNQAYFGAALYVLGIGAPFNAGNPYTSSSNQAGFGTFGPPHLAALIAEVATRALKAVWYQKWAVHRALRPEEFGGLLHLTLTGAKSYPLHSDVLNSQAAHQAHSRNGTYLLPTAFPEGCPQHPSYGAGHATVAGACATIVKAFFDETFVIPNPVIPNSDGTSLVAYTGSDAGQLTIESEMNKLAANVAIGRNFAGVHWRSDYQESLLLGEAVAISLLRDQRACYNETFAGLTFTKFDGTQITV